MSWSNFPNPGNGHCCPRGFGSCRRRVRSVHAFCRTSPPWALVPFRARGGGGDGVGRVRSSMATMATMATPRVRPPKYILELVGGGVNYRTPTPLFFKKNVLVSPAAAWALLRTKRPRDGGRGASHLKPAANSPATPARPPRSAAPRAPCRRPGPAPASTSAAWRRRPT